MKRDPVKAEVLATKIIPNVSPDMAKELNLEPGMKSLALITSTSDDVTYTALDEATKKADVKVVYAKSFYAGADTPTPSWPARSSECWQDQTRQKSEADLKPV